MSQETTDLNIETVMDWLDGEIVSIEKQEPLAVQEDVQGPQDNVMIAAAGSSFQESDDDSEEKEKINLPPEMGRRTGEETVALPFLRRKDVKEGVAHDPSDKQEEEESTDEDKVEKSIDGLKTWAFIEKAMDEKSLLQDSIILQAFSLDSSTDIDEISNGTLLKELLTSDSRPSEQWWNSCMDLALGLPRVTEAGALGATLYYRTDSFTLSDFMEKSTGDDTSQSGINITICGYKTKNFDVCPGSVAAFRKIEECLAGVRDPELRDLVSKAAQKTDQFLGKKKTLVDRGKADPNDIEGMVKTYAQVAYSVGRIAERMERSFSNEFIYAVSHIADVLPLMETGMELEKSADWTSSASNSTSTTSSVVLKHGDGDNSADNLIYTEEEDLGLCKCGEAIEKCGHRQDRRELESPAEDAPMQRAESRPNVIMRDQTCGCAQCASNLAKEELVPLDHIAVKNVKRSKLPDSDGPRGDAGEPQNSAAAGGDVPEGFGLSNEDVEKV